MLFNLTYFNRLFLTSFVKNVQEILISRDIFCNLIFQFLFYVVTGYSAK